jgi:hypothetical protein
MNGKPSLNHPLVSHLGIHSLAGCSETLDFCSDHLRLLTDLFGDTNEAYTVLDSNESRAAMHRTLLDVGLVLKAVSSALQLEADDARTDAAADSTD